MNPFLPGNSDGSCLGGDDSQRYPLVLPQSVVNQLSVTYPSSKIVGRDRSGESPQKLAKESGASRIKKNREEKTLSVRKDKRYDRMRMQRKKTEGEGGDCGEEEDESQMKEGRGGEPDLSSNLGMFDTGFGMGSENRGMGPNSGHGKAGSALGPEYSISPSYFSSRMGGSGIYNASFPEIDAIQLPEGVSVEEVTALELRDKVMPKLKLFATSLCRFNSDCPVRQLEDMRHAVCLPSTSTKPEIPIVRAGVVSRMVQMLAGERLDASNGPCVDVMKHIVNVRKGVMMRKFVREQMFRREALQLEQLQSGANHVHNTNIAQGQRQGQGQEQEQGGLMSQQLFQPQQQQQQIPSSQSSQSSQDQNNIQHMSFDYEHDGFTGGHLSNNNGNYQYNDSSYHNEIAEIMETDMGEMDRMLHARLVSPERPLGQQHFRFADENDYVIDTSRTNMTQYAYLTRRDLRFVETVKEGEAGSNVMAMLAYEAAWTLSLLACGEEPYALETFEHFHSHNVPAQREPPIIDHLVKIIAYCPAQQDPVREKALECIGNLSAFVQETRDLFLSKNVVVALLWQMGLGEAPPVRQILTPTLETMENVCWALSNLARGESVPDPQHAVLTIQALVVLLHCPVALTSLSALECAIILCDNAARSETSLFILDLLFEHGVFSKAYELLKVHQLMPYLGTTDGGGEACKTAMREYSTIRQVSLQLLCAGLRSPTSMHRLSLLNVNRFPLLLETLVLELGHTYDAPFVDESPPYVGLSAGAAEGGVNADSNSNNCSGSSSSASMNNNSSSNNYNNNNNSKKMSEKWAQDPDGRHNLGAGVTAIISRRSAQQGAAAKADIATTLAGLLEHEGGTAMAGDVCTVGGGRSLLDSLLRSGVLSAVDRVFDTAASEQYITSAHLAVNLLNWHLSSAASPPFAGMAIPGIGMASQGAGGAVSVGAGGVWTGDAGMGMEKGGPFTAESFGFGNAEAEAAAVAENNGSMYTAVELSKLVAMALSFAVNDGKDLNLCLRCLLALQASVSWDARLAGLASLSLKGDEDEDEGGEMETGTGTETEAGGAEEVKEKAGVVVGRVLGALLTGNVQAPQPVVEAAKQLEAALLNMP